VPEGTVLGGDEDDTTTATKKKTNKNTNRQKTKKKQKPQVSQNQKRILRSSDRRSISAREQVERKRQKGFSI